MKFKLLFLIAIFFNCYLNTKAATGCLSNSTTYTYINPEGINRNGVPSYYHRNEADRIISSNTSCVVNSGQGCYIYSTRSGYSSSPGTIVEYNNPANCPIDSYTIYLLGSSAIMGVALIKKKDY